MPNDIFRRRLINEIRHGVQEAEAAREIKHAGMVGRIRELVAAHVLKPMLPGGFEVGTGKIVDRTGRQSAETDLVIYNRAVLPPLMYSERDGLFPVESSYYAIEVKSTLTATEVQDAIRKGRTIIDLSYPGREHHGNNVITVRVLFAFGSDLSDSSSELDRYAQYDPGWLVDPIIKVICIVGRGYWYHKPRESAWVCCPPSADHDKVIELVSGTVNTLLLATPRQSATLLGHYLITERPTTIIHLKKSEA